MDILAHLSPNDPLVLRQRPADGGPPLREDEFAPMPGTLDFADALDAINPLHHLPGVGTIYRAISGDRIQPAMRVAGAAAFGGPVGMILAAIGSLADEIFSRGPAAGAAAYAAIERRDRSLIG